MTVIEQRTSTIEPARPLVDRERARRDEFERHYEATPEKIKAHLLDGIVHFDDFAGRFTHGNASACVSYCIGTYSLLNSALHPGTNSTIRLDELNEPQPDHILIIDERYGGRTVIDADAFILGGPEWVGEIALNDESIDLHLKLDIYRRFGVREVFVWRVEDSAVDWLERVDERFVAKARSADGVLRSGVLPGFWIDPDALLNRDFAKLNTTLRQGLASCEHAAFVVQLAAKKLTA